MIERKHRSESDDHVEPDSVGEGAVFEPAQVEVNSGYTVAVKYGENGKSVVDIKTYGQVDITRLLKEIEHVFPEAKIRRLTKS